MTAPELMLASTTDLRADEAVKTMTATGKWATEAKLDGIRAVAVVTPGSVRLFNRRKLDIGYRYPDVVRHLGDLGINAILDGEIIVLDSRGRPDFHMAHRRDAQATAKRAEQLARRMPAKFVAFDVLFTHGIDVQGQPYTKRRRWLEDLKRYGLDVNPSSDDGEAVWQFAKAHDLEGVVLKRKDSPYRPERSGDWIKVKRSHRISALVSGYEPGNGHRAATFGALKLSLLNDSWELVPIGSVGTGFTNADCINIRRLLDTSTDPVIVEVEYLEVSPSGQLRNPSYKGRRLDIALEDCSMDQLRIPGAGE